MLLVLHTGSRLLSTVSVLNALLKDSTSSKDATRVEAIATSSTDATRDGSTCESLRAYVGFGRP